MVNRECISPRGPALRWGSRVWPFGGAVEWAPLVTLGDRPPQVEGNGGGMNYSAMDVRLHWGYWCPLTHCAKAPQTPSCAPQPCLRLSLHVRQEQHGLFNHTEKKTGDKKNTITRCIRLVYVCACAKEREVCVQKWRWFDILVLKYFFLYPRLYMPSLLKMDVEFESVKKNLHFSKKKFQMM